MNPNDAENINSINDTEETVNDTAGEIALDDEIQLEDESDSLRKQIETLKAQKEHWKSKAERVSKSDTPESRVNQDLIALTTHKVHADDVPRVEKFARLEGITIAEALKDDMLKTILSKSEELRNTAVATNTSSSRRSNIKPSLDTILKNARDGKDVDDPVALAEARFAERYKNK